MYSYNSSDRYCSPERDSNLGPKRSLALYTLRGWLFGSPTRRRDVVENLKSQRQNCCPVFGRILFLNVCYCNPYVKRPFVWSSHIHKTPQQIRACSLFYLLDLLYHYQQQFIGVEREDKLAHIHIVINCPYSVAQSALEKTYTPAFLIGQVSKCTGRNQLPISWKELKGWTLSYFVQTQRACRG